MILILTGKNHFLIIIGTVYHLVCAFSLFHYLYHAYSYFLLIEDFPMALPQHSIILDDLRESVLPIPKIRHDFPETWIWNETDSRYAYFKGNFYGYSKAF